MSAYFYIQSLLNNLVVTVEGFRCDGDLRLYPAYGGANQLWKWGANNSLVSKMGLFADYYYHDPRFIFFAGTPTGTEKQSWQYANNLMKNNDKDSGYMTVDKTAIVASYPYLAELSGELNQKWILMPEEKLGHL